MVVTPLRKSNILMTSQADGINITLKAKMNEYRKGRLIGNTQNHWQQVAEIPSMVYMDLMKKFGDPHNNPEAQKKWKAWLNDIDNRYFRTGGGNV